MKTPAMLALVTIALAVSTTQAGDLLQELQAQRDSAYEEQDLRDLKERAADADQYEMEQQQREFDRMMARPNPMDRVFQQVEAYQRARQAEIDAAVRGQDRQDQQNEMQRKLNDIEDDLFMQNMRQSTQGAAPPPVQVARQPTQAELQAAFVAAWEANAGKVIADHPELADTKSLHSLWMVEFLKRNPVYWWRLDGFELAYKIMTAIPDWQWKQLAQKSSQLPDWAKPAQAAPNVFDQFDQQPKPTPGTTQVATSGKIENPANVAASNDRRIEVINAPLKVEVQMRFEHNSKSASVTSLHRGDRVVVEAERVQNNDPPFAVTWQKVTTMSGQSGWVNAEYLSPAQ